MTWLVFGLFWGALIVAAIAIWLLLLSDIGTRKNIYSSTEVREKDKGCWYCNKGRGKKG